jgi:hypothetical protein
MADRDIQQASSTIDAHGTGIDALHKQLAALPGIDQAKLQKVVDTYKAAHKQFRDDALGCMN